MVKINTYTALKITVVMRNNGTPWTSQLELDNMNYAARGWQLSFIVIFAPQYQLVASAYFLLTFSQRVCTLGQKICLSGGLSAKSFSLWLMLLNLATITLYYDK